MSDSFSQCRNNFWFQSYFSGVLNKQICHYILKKVWIFLGFRIREAMIVPFHMIFFSFSDELEEIDKRGVWDNRIRLVKKRSPWDNRIRLAKKGWDSRIRLAKKWDNRIRLAKKWDNRIRLAKRYMDWDKRIRLAKKSNWDNRIRLVKKDSLGKFIPSQKCTF